MKTLQEALRLVDWDKVDEEEIAEKLDDLQLLLQETSSDWPKTPRQLRVCLARDIFNSAWLELPPTKAFLYAFSDGVSIEEWAYVLGIRVEVNKTPDAEFKTKTTLRFTDARHERTPDTYHGEDEEL